MGRVQGRDVFVTDIEEGADDDRELENAADDEAEDAGDANRIPAATARDVCEYVVKQIVEEPDGVEVDVNDRGRVTAIEVRVAQGDMGRVIGKRGRIAQSIRTVVRAAAVRDGATVDVEFLE